MSLSSDISTISSSLNAIKNAIIDKGVTPTGNITTYADAISQIPNKKDISTLTELWPYAASYNNYPVLYVDFSNASKNFAVYDEDGNLVTFKNIVDQESTCGNLLLEYIQEDQLDTIDFPLCYYLNNSAAEIKSIEIFDENGHYVYQTAT